MDCSTGILWVNGCFLHAECYCFLSSPNRGGIYYQLLLPTFILTIRNFALSVDFKAFAFVTNVRIAQAVACSDCTAALVIRDHLYPLGHVPCFFYLRITKDHFILAQAWSLNTGFTVAAVTGAAAVALEALIVAVAVALAALIVAVAVALAALIVAVAVALAA